MLVAAKIQLARSYQKESDWGQAIRVWEQAKELKDITSPQKARVLFQLADCYLQAGRRSDAAAALDQLRKSGGDEALASALKLAELQLNDPGQCGSRSANTRNRFAQIGRSRALSELSLGVEGRPSHLRTGGGVVPAFGRICSVDSCGPRLCADCREGSRPRAGGRDLGSLGPGSAESGHDRGKDPPRTVEEGIKRVREAAAEWQALADLKTKPVEQGDLLRRAADLYLKIGDLSKALSTLDDFTIRVAGYPMDRMAEFWLQKGELYLKVGNKDQARICFQSGIQLGEQFPGTTLLRCRVRLAEMMIQSKDGKSITRALDDLEKVLSEREIGNEKELHQQALTLIADALFQQGEYAKAETRFRIVLDNYPDGPKANYPRFQLGLCYYRQAGMESDRCKEADKVRNDPTSSSKQKQEADTKFKQCHSRYMELLKRASAPFKACETALQQIGSQLSREDAVLLKRTSFFAADCAYYLGEFEEAMRRYDAMTQRYTGTVVELEAFKQQYECQRFLKNQVKAKDLLDHMRTAYARMHDTAFDGTSDIRTCAYWIKWFEDNQP